MNNTVGNIVRIHADLDLVSMKGFPMFRDGAGQMRYPRDGIRQFIKSKTQYNFD